MAISDNDYVTARLLDFWGRRTPWQRRLWNLGSVCLLREVIETANMLSAGHFRPGTVANLAQSAIPQVLQDEGLGSKFLRQELKESLKLVDKDTSAVRRLEILTEDIAPKYLEHWLLFLATPGSKIRCEFLARSLGAHLLDADFSPEQLHR